MRDLTRADWERNRLANIELIANNMMQIEMAEGVIKLCDEKIKEFPVEEIPDSSDNPDAD